MEGTQEIDSVLQSHNSELIPVLAFAHYLGQEKEEIKRKFKRVHECNLYERKLE